MVSRSDVATPGLESIWAVFDYILLYTVFMFVLLQLTPHLRLRIHGACEGAGTSAYIARLVQHECQ